MIGERTRRTRTVGGEEHRIATLPEPAPSGRTRRGRPPRGSFAPAQARGPTAESGRSAAVSPRAPAATGRSAAVSPRAPGASGRAATAASPPCAAARRSAAVALPPAAALGVAALVAAVGAEAFWLCVPVAVLAAAVCRTRVGVAVQVAFAGVAAAAPLVVDGGPGPSPWVAAAVLALSAGVAAGLRERLESGNAALRALSSVDALTGLANRRLLDERLAYEIARHARHRRSLALLVLDLDGFKRVNDRFGHPAGDEVLRDVAAALEATVREQDTVARPGGDEFCVLAPETGAEAADQLGRRLEAAVARAVAGLEGLSASVGYAVYPRDGADPAALTARADAAQTERKRASAKRGLGRRHAA